MLNRIFFVLLILISPSIGLADSFINANANATPFSQNTAPKKQIWNLKDADIRAVIQTISLVTGKNFIIDPRVTGNVTFVSQKPMAVPEIYQAFLSMLQVLHYAAIPSGHVIKIVPVADAKKYGGMLASRIHPGKGDEVVVRVIHIDNVSALQMVPIIRSMIQSWASVKVYMPSNSLILVGPAANLSHLAIIIRRMDSKNANVISILRLKHASAKNLVTILQALQKNNRAEGRVVNVSLAADPESNSILISGNVNALARMRRLIRQLDRPTANGGDTVVVHLNYLNAKKLAPVLNHIATGQSTNVGNKNKVMDSGIAGISIQAEESNNAIIIHAPVAILQSLRRVIRQLDVRPSQVLVEAIIVKVDQTLLNQLGIVWGTVDSNGTPTNVVDSTTGVANGSTSMSTPNTFAMKVTQGIGFISGGNLAVLIHALRGSTSSDILATPSIVVLNNKSATISDGKNIGVINRQYSSTVEGNNQITPFNTIERQDVALSLKVTPQISPNNMIRLKITQQNNSIDPSSTGNIDNPTLDVSKITTSVLVHSGDILVLGGLINNNRVEGVQKIPVLGDIPLIGLLFRYKSYKIEKQNLMIFIKPIILNDQVRARHQTLQRYNYMRHLQTQSSSRHHSRSNSSILPELKTATHHHRYAHYRRHHVKHRRRPSRHHHTH